MQPREDEQNPQQPEDVTFNPPQNEVQPQPEQDTPSVDQPAPETTPGVSPEPTTEPTPEPATPESVGGITFGETKEQEPAPESTPEVSTPETTETPAFGATAEQEPVVDATPDVSPATSQPVTPVTNETPDSTDQSPANEPTPTPTNNETGMIPPMAPQSGGKSRKRIWILTAVIVLLLAAGAAAYWFFLRPEADDTANNQQNNEQAENNQEEDLPPIESELTVLTLENKVIEDTEMGYTVTVTRMVPDFPVTNTNWSANNEAVLVEFKVETDGKFNGSPGDGNLRLIADDGIGSLTTALISDDEIKAQGFTPFPDTKATVDTPVVGFLAFAIPKDSQVLTLRYERMAATNISTGETIPAKNFDVVIQ